MTIEVDVHAHLVPAVEARLAGMAGVVWDAAAGAMTIDGYRLGVASVFRPQALLDWMDAQGVKRAWISAPPPTYRMQLDEAACAAWCAYLNEGLAEIGARHDRLLPMLHLPVQHPALAAQIAQRATAAGQRRFSMPAGAAQQGLVLSDPAYDPLWAALDAAGAFLFLHPGKGCDGRLDDFYLHNLLGNPVETGIAAAHLAMSGVLQTHARITVCLAHAGGISPSIVGRLARGQETRRPGSQRDGVEPTTTSFRRFCADCIAHGASALDAAADTFGEDRILFGSDWPFVMGLPEPAAQLKDVPEALRRRIHASDPSKLMCAPA
jgi:aminocarboxymuconate-semialdehyde decarboxylase